jgi:hypothetical protein
MEGPSAAVMVGCDNQPSEVARVGASTRFGSFRCESGDGQIFGAGTIITIRTVLPRSRSSR